MSIKSYRGTDDLEEFGINPLTGEACGLSMRILCDLTQKGVNLWQEFTRSTPTAEPWNRHGVKSVMIPTCMFEDLWIFAQVRENKAIAVLKGGYPFGKKNWQPTAMAIFSYTELSNIESCIVQKLFKATRWYKKSTAPGTGLDNQHAFSGRIT
jgi:hypothetical protein